MRGYATTFFDDDELSQLLADNPQLLSADPDRFCPTCGKKGVYRDQLTGEEHECDCRQQLHLHKHYLAAGIGLTYQRLGWEDYVGDDENVSALVSYYKNAAAYINRGMGLILTGEVGTGKTLLATLLLKELVKQGHTGFASLFESALKMYAAGFGDKEAQARFQRKVLAVEVLLLDDVGREMATRLTGSTLDLVLRTRVQYGRPTFITTNLTMDEMETGVIDGITTGLGRGDGSDNAPGSGGGYGMSILSLLREKSILLEFSGEDFRPQANARELDEIKRGVIRPII